MQVENDLNLKINESIFNRFFDLLEDSLSKHKNIELRNFGVFKSKLMPSRYGSNPQNKKKIYIPSKWKVVFKISESLNKKLNNEI